MKLTKKSLELKWEGKMGFLSHQNEADLLSHVKRAVCL